MARGRKNFGELGLSVHVETRVNARGIHGVYEIVYTLLSLHYSLSRKFMP